MIAKRPFAAIVLAVTLALSTGCYSELAYVPQPQRVRSPQTDFDRLVKLHWEYLPVKIQFGDGYAQLSWVARAAQTERVAAKVVNFAKLRTTHIGKMMGRWINRRVRRHRTRRVL